MIGNCAGDTCENWDREGGEMSKILRLLYMFVFVWGKNERNVWHFSVVKGEEVLSYGLRSELMVKKDPWDCSIQIG